MSDSRSFGRFAAQVNTAVLSLCGTTAPWGERPARTWWSGPAQTGPGSTTIGVDGTVRFAAVTAGHLDKLLGQRNRLDPAVVRNGRQALTSVVRIAAMLALPPEQQDPRRPASVGQTAYEPISGAVGDAWVERNFGAVVERLTAAGALRPETAAALMAEPPRAEAFSQRALQVADRVGEVVPGGSDEVLRRMAVAEPHAKAETAATMWLNGAGVSASLAQAQKSPEAARWQHDFRYRHAELAARLNDLFVRPGTDSLDAIAASVHDFQQEYSARAQADIWFAPATYAETRTESSGAPRDGDGSRTGRPAGTGRRQDLQRG